MRILKRWSCCRSSTTHWKDHLLGMDHLRDGIGLRGYGQKDPLIEYKREGFDMFAGMMDRIKSDTLERLFHVQAVRGENPRRHLQNQFCRHAWCSIVAKNRRHKSPNTQPRRSAATIPALAAAARNTKNVTEHSPRGGGKILLTYGSWSRLPLHLVLSFRVFSP